MKTLSYLAALALLLSPAIARADDKPATTSDVNRGVDANRPKAPDPPSKVERHWDPDHVEAKERTPARNDTRRTAANGRDETIDERRKVEKHRDGSMRAEIEKTHVYD